MRINSNINLNKIKSLLQLRLIRQQNDFGSKLSAIPV